MNLKNVNPPLNGVQVWCQGGHMTTGPRTLADLDAKPGTFYCPIHRPLPGRLAPTWDNQLLEARKLPDAELDRHASVSRNNGHHCRECFTCACVVVQAERGTDLARIARSHFPGQS